MYTFLQFIILPSLAVLLASCAGSISEGIFLNTDAQAVIDSPFQEQKGDLELDEIESLIDIDGEVAALDREDLWQKDSTEFNFPVVINKQVDIYLNLYQKKARRQFGLWLARSMAYRSIIEKELEQAGLPNDLLYLAMIESGFNQLARSPAKAIGLWQFMKGTARQYNLQINQYVDERRDALKSTKAAVAYLADLYNEFDDWHLAVAAYNGGPGKIRHGLKKYEVDNFWDLASKKYLRLETKHYVPKLIATLLIAKDPEKYGFTNITFHKPLVYDTITVGPGMSLDAVALISNTSAKEIRRLNYELKMGKTPANKARYEINIPPAGAEIAKRNISRLHSIVSTGYKNHTSQKGDTVAKIGKRYGINRATLLKVNNLRSGTLARGQNIKIPYNRISYQLLPEGSPGAMTIYKDSLVLHHIVPGDTISKIAARYNIPQSLIIAWNGLKDAHSIRTGKQLALYINKGHPKTNKQVAIQSLVTKPAHVITLKPRKKKVLLAEANSAYQWYSVRNGDSLWAISKKISASLANIKKWNNLKSNLIHPGVKLKFKKV